MYPPDGNSPKYTNYLSGNIKLGDWRPGFLKAGAPLVFVTAFKLLDMVLEWVMTENGRAITFQFSEKIKTLKGIKGAIRFPAPIDREPWLGERLIALYEALEPLRGTIVHERHFKSTDGALDVAASRRGVIGPKVTISASDLRNLAVVLLFVREDLLGRSSMDPFTIRRVRRALDDMLHLHGQPALNQLQPGRLRVRKYLAAAEVIDLDLAQIRSDICATCPTRMWFGTCGSSS